MTDGGLVPIRFYSEFMKQDWPALPQGAQDSLANFLLKLQKDPNDSEILDNAESDRAGRLAYEFSPGFVVYWKTVTEIAQPQRIEVLAVRKNEFMVSEPKRQTTPSSDTSAVEQQDSIEKVFSRTTRLGNLAMWGSLHVSQRTGKVAGWIVDSWSEWGAPYLRPKMHWVSLPEHKLHRMQLNIDFKSTMHVGPEDTDIEPERLIFIRATLKQWERDWLEEESKKIST